VVEPGVITGHLKAEAAQFGLHYPPDPSSANFCTIGGNVAENAGGSAAVKYGVTREYVLGLRVVLPTGEIIEVKLLKPSGVRAYDEAVQRALAKSSPLPRPERAEVFQRTLTLRFRPKD